LARETNISVKHQSGKNKQKQVRADYLGLHNVDVIEFIDNMEEAFAWSDIIICRAGALTVAEVAGAGRVAIFVPLPIAVDDHQTANAKYLSDKHAAILIPQEKLEGMLLKQMRDLSASAEMRGNIAKAAKASAHESATSAVGSIIEQVSKINNSPSKTQTTNKGQA
jgi:UDP-N-acetylglucosamine--N-acetylmuramyl-(pentapeptide) pyrophosphoryl-undecaprenol N-acetylglucosamine transferase